VDRLAQMKFKVIPNVNSAKLSVFVKKIEERKTSNATVHQEIKGSN
jgi:hypothetical protein